MKHLEEAEVDVPTVARLSRARTKLEVDRIGADRHCVVVGWILAEAIQTMNHARTHYPNVPRSLTPLPNDLALSSVQM